MALSDKTQYKTLPEYFYDLFVKLVLCKDFKLKII